MRVHAHQSTSNQLSVRRAYRCGSHRPDKLMCQLAEARVERAPDKLQIDAERPTAARRPLRPLHHEGIFDLLGHGARRRSQTSQPEAKDTCRSKLPVAGHDIWPSERSPGGAPWLKARRMGKPPMRHGKRFWAAPAHVWEVSEMVGCICRACISSWHWRLSPRPGEERRHA